MNANKYLNQFFVSLLLAAAAHTAPAADPAETPKVEPAKIAAPKVETPRTGALAPDLYVNGVLVSKGQVEMLMQSLLSNNADQEKGDLDARRLTARKELASQEALSQLAVAEGMDKELEVVDALNHARREILSRVYIQNYFAENPISNAMLKTGYEWSRNNGKIMEYKVRQILLSTRESADNVMARLEKGEAFIDLTKLTRDPGGNTNGGYLSKTGWFRPDIFVDPYFSDEVEKQAQKKGQYSSKPFRTRFGWHIILVEDSRVLVKPEAFAKLHPNVLEAMRQKAAQRKLTELITNAATQTKLTDANGKSIDYSTLKPKP